MERHRVQVRTSGESASVMRRDELRQITDALKGIGQKLVRIVERRGDGSLPFGSWWVVVDAEPARHWYYDGDA